MKKNPNLLICIGLFGFALIVGFIWMGATSAKNTETVAKKNGNRPVFDVASGDTNNEVLKSILARQKALASKNAQLQSINQKLQTENQASTQQALAHTQQVLQQRITTTEAHLESQLKAVMQKTQGVHHARSQSSRLEYPMAEENKPSKNTSRLITTVPDLSAGVDDLTSHPTLASSNQVAKSESLEAPILPSDHVSGDRKQSIPFYSIPDGATIANTVLLSPLVGEVPVSGQLQSPAFPFKAVISRFGTQNMFAANGIPLPPGIAGTILQGYAVGDMSLGCARAYVTKILFVFHDGHYVVFPKDRSAENDDATRVYPKDAIGYLSDPYNNACITGKYLTDAPKVIASLTAFGAAAGAGGAIARAQTQTFTNLNYGTAGNLFTGNLGKYAGGLALAGAAKAALKWYQARVNNVFDAIFVSSTVGRQPRQLIFNVTRTIPIDLNQPGRTLRHETAYQLSATDHSLE